MKEFSIEKAKEGKQVVTKDGRLVRIICYDRKIRNENLRLGPIIGLVLGHRGVFEMLVHYTKDGKEVNGISELDLFIKE